MSSTRRPAPKKLIEDTHDTRAEFDEEEDSQTQGRTDEEEAVRAHTVLRVFSLRRKLAKDCENIVTAETEVHWS
ncbi:hypothetical protein K504DRAFT_508714 [Pleomassaria siparia CBS 279.74]|uniref:Uncharacterized protein n=1 Tax=Pleomassaria siparia CBS 279.74 TaxID=1314801 RepID=A0A6G1JQ50_9PLEO|nr:hypothetical protein K504DRAFT_508714 [Pleomassaria siparia CBS 279.74]